MIVLDETLTENLRLSIFANVDERDWSVKIGM